MLQVTDFRGRFSCTVVKLTRAVVVVFVTVVNVLAIGHDDMGCSCSFALLFIHRDKLIILNILCPVYSYKFIFDYFIFLTSYMFVYI